MEIKTVITSLAEFEAWSGAIPTRDKIVQAGKGEQFIDELESLSYESMTDTQLNDLLWFESDFCLGLVGLATDDDSDDDDSDDDNE